MSWFISELPLLPMLDLIMILRLISAIEKNVSSFWLKSPIDILNNWPYPERVPYSKSLVLLDIRTELSNGQCKITIWWAELNGQGYLFTVHVQPQNGQRFVQISCVTLTTALWGKISRQVILLVFFFLVCVVTNYLPLCNGDNMSQASRPIVQFRVTVTQSRGDHMGEVTAGVTTKQTANKTEESDLRNHNSLPTMMEHWSIKKHAKYTWALHEQYLS